MRRAVCDPRAGAIPPPGGPIVLVGIDAEDMFGRTGQHGPIANYIQLVNDMLLDAPKNTNSILVLGGGKNSTDDVTRFWP